MAGLYLHIPFCLSKCVYCGFYSVGNTKWKSLFLSALKEEIALRRDYLAGERIHTLYFGGGTPSLLEIREVEEILDNLSAHFNLTDLTEVTFEANPEQLTTAYCRGLRACGINRLSIGVQSFQDPVLRFMGRRHTAKQALDALENAAHAGFENLSIDLIYGINTRSDEQWAEDVKTALSLPIRHLSCYALTSEENSILFKQIQTQRQPPPDEEQAARQYQILLQTLRGTQFEQYEVSNFSIPGWESKHNSAYWNHTPYLGLGPSAHSFNGHSRQWNPANIRQYQDNIIRGIPYEEAETLHAEDLYNETLLLSLRTRHGIDLHHLQTQFGEERVKSLRAYFHNSVEAKHYIETESRLRLTEAGLWFADGIAGNAFEV